MGLGQMEIWSNFDKRYFKRYLNSKLFLMFSKLIATLVSLVFSIYYSTSLGLERKSILVFIMTSSLLLNLVLNSGISYYFRDSYEKKIDQALFRNYAIANLLNLLPTLVFLEVLFEVYEQLQVQIQPNLKMAGIIYAISVNFNLMSIDFCFATKKLIQLIFLEISTIFSQILFYLVFSRLIQFSEIVSVLLAFSTTYFFNFIFVLFYVDISARIFSVDVYKEIYAFYKSSRRYHLVGILSTLLDRTDKILIGLFLPGADLSKFSATNNLFIFFRFFPDTYLKMLVSGISTFRKIRIPRLFSVGLIFPAILITPKIMQFLIENTYGSNWNLPYTMVLMILIQEIARSVFQFKIASRLKQTNVIYPGYYITVLIIGLLLLIVLLPKWGLISAPFVISLIYLFIGFIPSRLIK